MGFLLRTGFWFSLVLLVLPLDVAGTGAQSSVGPVETFVAARQALGDVAGLCDREPAACEIGRSALHTVGLRAREAARIAYQMLDENLDDRPDTTTLTGGIEGIIESDGHSPVAKMDAPSARTLSVLP